jgi:hypothetical protein
MYLCSFFFVVLISSSYVYLYRRVIEEAHNIHNIISLLVIRMHNEFEKKLPFFFLQNYFLLSHSF